MTTERLAELERVLALIEDEEERRRIWAAVEQKKLDRLRVEQKKAQTKAQQSPAKPAIRKKGGWVFVNNGKILRPGTA